MEVVISMDKKNNKKFLGFEITDDELLKLRTQCDFWLNTPIVNDEK